MLGGDTEIVYYVTHCEDLLLDMTWLHSKVSKYPFHFAAEEIRAHSTDQPGLHQTLSQKLKQPKHTHTHIERRGGGRYCKLSAEDHALP